MWYLPRLLCYHYGYRVIAAVTLTFARVLWYFEVLLQLPWYSRGHGDIHRDCRDIAAVPSYSVTIRAYMCQHGPLPCPPKMCCRPFSIYAQVLRPLTLPAKDLPYLCVEWLVDLLPVAHWEMPYLRHVCLCLGIVSLEKIRLVRVRIRSRRLFIALCALPFPPLTHFAVVIDGRA